MKMQNALEMLEDMDSEAQRLLSYLIALTVLDDEDFDFIQFELVWYMGKAMDTGSWRPLMYNWLIFVMHY